MEIADLRAVEFHAQNAVVADLLKRCFHSREVDGAVAERAECAHFVCTLCGLQSVGVYVFEVHVRKARADLLDEFDGDMPASVVCAVSMQNET